MTALPLSYDAWKTRSPDDERCEPTAMQADHMVSDADSITSTENPEK
jgi:hypothetical protein